MAAAKKKAPAKKKAVAKKAAPAKAPAKVKAIGEKMTKTQMVSTIAENTGLTKKQVSDVMGELENLIHGSIKKRSVGEITIPGLMKIYTKKIPAKKARKNVPNPFKPGELMDVAAKPARTDVKVRPLKKMKEFANS